MHLQMPSLLSLSSFINSAPALSPTSSEFSVESDLVLSPTDSEFGPIDATQENDGKKGSLTMHHSNYSQMFFSPRQSGGEWSGLLAGKAQ